MCRSHGGTDMKVTTSKLARNLQFIAQSGPTWDPLPPFRCLHVMLRVKVILTGPVCRWSEQDFKDTPHVGHPDTWTFPPVIPAWHIQDM